MVCVSVPCVPPPPPPRVCGVVGFLCCSLVLGFLIVVGVSYLFIYLNLHSLTYIWLAFLEHVVGEPSLCDGSDGLSIVLSVLDSHLL